MNCYKCGKEVLGDACWTCGDDEVIKKWHKPLSNKEVTELDKKVRPAKYETSPKLTLPNDSKERKDHPLYIK